MTAVEVERNEKNLVLTTGALHHLDIQRRVKCTESLTQRDFFRHPDT